MCSCGPIRRSGTEARGGKVAAKWADAKQFLFLSLANPDGHLLPRVLKEVCLLVGQPELMWKNL